MDYRLPSDFWKSFARDHWRQKPAVFKGLFKTPIVTEAEQFETMCAAADRWRRRDSQTGPGSATFRLFLGNRNLSSDATAHLPQRSDGGIDGYAERLERRVGKGSEFCLLVDRVPTYSYPIYSRLRHFYSGLIKEIGMPVQSADADQFLGNYRYTPFGLHKDNAESFVFITRRKRMLLWPYHQLENMVNGDQREAGYTMDMAEVPPALRERAIVLEGEPGDVFYWPASYWHVGEGTGTISLTLNLPLFAFDTAASHVFPELERMVRSKLPRSTQTLAFDPERPEDAAGQLPAALEEGLRVTQRLAAEQLERAVRLRWLRLTTSLGFKEVIEPDAPKNLSPSQRVQRAPEAGFAWITPAPGELAWAADGHVNVRPESQGLRSLLELVHRGEVHTVGDLCERVAQEHRGEAVIWSSQHALEVVQELVSHRVLTLLD